jgi:activator of HSP90 ATPase
MKQLTANPNFQQSMKKTQDLLNDPNKVKEMEEKMTVALEQGKQQLDQVKKLEETKAPSTSSNNKKKKKNNKKGKKASSSAPVAASEQVAAAPTTTTVAKVATDDASKAKNDGDDEIPDIPNLSLN